MYLLNEMQRQYCKREEHWLSFWIPQVTGRAKTTLTVAQLLPFLRLSAICKEVFVGKGVRHKTTLHIHSNAFGRLIRHFDTILKDGYREYG